MQPSACRAFPMGKIVVTKAAAGVLSVSEILWGLSRHASGYWGELRPDDWLENEIALMCDSPLLSKHQPGCSVAFLIITEGDRSATTILLPEDL